MPEARISLKKESYNDTGCNLAPSCLNCPLPQCKHDLPVRIIKGKPARDQLIYEAVSRKGFTFKETAERYKVNVRTVFRIVKEQNALKIQT